MQDTSTDAFFTDHAVVFGLLMFVLILVFYTSGSKNKYIQGFYSIIPPLLLCYFLPGLLNSFGLIDGENSPLPSIGSRFLLPSCLILYTLNLDLPSLWKLRKRAGLFFLLGTLGIVLGGPLAIWLTAMISPDLIAGQGADAIWRGFGSLAGSWIGGSANQVALKEILQPSAELFSTTIAVDVFVAYLWMALLLFGAAKTDKINKWLKADDSDVKELTKTMEAYQQENSRLPEARDLILMVAVAFFGTGLATLASKPVAGYIAINFPMLERFSLDSDFFWLILFSTLFGVALSFTKARRLEYAGASKMATLLLYVLIVTIGMQMNILAILQKPGLFIIGFIWIFFHAALLIIMAKITRTPFFYVAMGSMSNVGGVASASVTATAFHPSLISVAVILSVFSYTIGTYAAWVCAMLMKFVVEL